MRLKVDYYILIPKGEWERLHKSLNEAVATISVSVRELGDAFGGVAEILRDDKFYKAICEANKYIKEQEEIK